MQSHETNPIGIFLVSSGTRGDRLLFRYPYDPPTTEEHIHESENPYAVKALTKSEDFDVSRIAVKELNADPVSGPLSGYPDIVLSHLLCIRSNICRRKFQLKVNNIIFIGYPMQLVPPPGSGHVSQAPPAGGAGSQSTPIQPSPKREAQTSSGSFNIAFAVKADVCDYVLSAYQELARQIGTVLIHDERRCGYFTQQKQMMWEIQDESNMSPEDNNIGVEAFRVIVQRCSLAKQLIQIFTNLCEDGAVQLYVNKWIPVSFCLVPKCHSSVLLGTGRHTPVKYETIRKCVEAIRPYHSVLLLDSEKSLLNCLPVDASPSLTRLIKATNPLKNIYSLAIDLDLSVEQVLQVVCHLVYWAKAAVIFPICDFNVYLLSPHCNMSTKSSLVEEFSSLFPGLSLPRILAQFSVRSSLRDHLDVLCHRYNQLLTIPVLIWLLRHHFLYQVHTYVMLLPPSDDLEYQSLNFIPPLVSDVHTDPVLVNDNTQQRVNTSDVHTDPISANDSISFSGQSEATINTGPVESRRRHRTLKLLSQLSPAQLRAVYKVPASSNIDDLKLFARLCSYFNGQHHLEEIIFYENIKRSQVVALLEKFHEILVLIHHEEPDISYWMHS